MSKGIKTLSMLKMEKNFVAVIEKGYSRQPYKRYSLADCLSFVCREMEELELAVRQYYASRHIAKLSEESLNDIRLEIADVSNTLDYLFEKTVQCSTSKEDSSVE